MREENWGLGESSVVATSLYALTNLRMVREDGGSWDYNTGGDTLLMEKSHWLTEEGVRDRLFPLLAGRFPCSMRGVQRRVVFSPARGGAISWRARLRGEGQGVGRLVIGDEDVEGVRHADESTKCFSTRVYDFEASWWRIRHLDGDWKELNHLEV